MNVSVGDPPTSLPVCPSTAGTGVGGPEPDMPPAATQAVALARTVIEDKRPPPGSAWTAMQPSPQGGSPQGGSSPTEHPANIPRPLSIGGVRLIPSKSLTCCFDSAWFAHIRAGELPRLGTRVRFPSPALCDGADRRAIWSSPRDQSVDQSRSGVPAPPLPVMITSLLCESVVVEPKTCALFLPPSRLTPPAVRSTTLQRRSVGRQKTHNIGSVGQLSVAHPITKKAGSMHDG
jgi:hypothetical protein